ncbi:ribokinase [Ligilactobacillus equi]
MVNKVTVLGSLNVDTILKIKRLPQPGETMAMEAKKNAGGGKGSNQAVAASRLGAQTSFIGKVGNDENGRFMQEILTTAQVDTQYVSVSEDKATGQAFILLQASGENSIIIDGGSNQAITTDDIYQAQAKIEAADFLVTQFETPLESATLAFEIAKKAGVTTILNPAPAQEAPQTLLANVDLIAPNETEAEILTGIKVVDAQSQHQAAKKLQAKGVKNVIITLGSRGAYYLTADQKEGLVPAFKVQAVDTTAAGDTFLGALSSQLKPDFSNIEEAILFANQASALAVQKLGAVPSIPTFTEVSAQLNQ